MYGKFKISLLLQQIARYSSLICLIRLTAEQELDATYLRC